MSAAKRSTGETRQAVAKLLDKGVSGAEIARRLGISKPTVCFHLRMLGVPPAVEFSKRYDWEAIRDFYDSGHSMTECIAVFGFSRNAWWDAIRRGVISPRPRLEPIESVLKRGKRGSRHHVKLRLIKAGIKERRCEQCGCSEWQGKTLSLELHHINGDGTDNRLDNLELLCPNCHSQTDTWGGRNKGRSAADQLRPEP
ncbi:MAG TPA: helix-turn-helix domain-containing protein [Solirubrobacteraceae bacterium]|jgi:predicted DNA-binding protein YlxM (UPF0122 family)